MRGTYIIESILLKQTNKKIKQEMERNIVKEYKNCLI